MAPTAPAPAAAPSAPPRAFRAVHGRVVAGVARGIAEHLHWPVGVVRLIFVALALAGGMGVLLYAGYWVVLPLAPSPGADDDPADRSLAPLLGLAAVAVGVLLLLGAAGLQAGGTVVALVVAGLGVALLWRQADDTQRRAWLAGAGEGARRTAEGTRRHDVWRTVAGVVLVLVGAVAVLAGRGSLEDALRSLLAGLVLALGAALVAFPWLARLWRDLAEERRARVRSEERAEVAAVVHDSVLQTLTLIRARAGDAAEVTRLARAEERALRSWLYAPDADPAATLRGALEAAAAEVEDEIGATVEVVVVGGDLPLDTRLASLAAATREAVLNAAKHAPGSGPVRVYAEVSGAAIEVFVRDRGPGFDPAAVPADRLGLRESVVGRMERAGGRAEVRSVLDEGTEVHLVLPRSAL